MNLRDKIYWLKEYQKGLMDFVIIQSSKEKSQLLNEWLERGSKHVPLGLLKAAQKLGICEEIAAITAQLEAIESLETVELNYGQEATPVIIQSGLNKNRQGIPLSQLRKIPKIERTWSPLQ